jgi:hypothetical protein
MTNLQFEKHSEMGANVWNVKLVADDFETGLSIEPERRSARVAPQNGGTISTSVFDTGQQKEPAKSRFLRLRRGSHAAQLVSGRPGLFGKFNPKKGGDPQ